MQAHPLEARLAHVEGTFVQVNERLGSIDCIASPKTSDRS